MAWPDLTAVFLLGLAGSGHCIGMCGVFGLAVSAGSRSGRELALRHLAYQLGKGTSYAFLGILLLLITLWVSSTFPLLQLQRWIGVFVGVVMIAAGVLLALERRLPHRWVGALGSSTYCQSLSALWRSPSLFRAVLVGWMNGFLPCGLSLIALMFLARTDSVSQTIVGAFVFTAGTLPALLAVGWLGQRIGVQARRTWMRLSGVLLIVFGLLTALRDQPSVHGLFHPLMPELPGGGGGHEHHPQGRAE